MIVQRYCRAYQPVARGDTPFIVQGENFKRRDEAITTIGTMFKRDDDERFATITAISEFLLFEHYVEAAWVISAPMSLEDRWKAAIKQLTSEIPDLKVKAPSSIHSNSVEYQLKRGFFLERNIAAEVDEFLDGVPTIENRRSYMMHDKPTIEIFYAPEQLLMWYNDKDA